MLDFLEFLFNLLDVGDLVSRTGEEVLARFDIHSNFFVEFVVGLVVWTVGIGLIITVVVMVGR